MVEEKATFDVVKENLKKFQRVSNPGPRGCRAGSQTTGPRRLGEIALGLTQFMWSEGGNSNFFSKQLGLAQEGVISLFQYMVSAYQMKEDVVAHRLSTNWCQKNNLGG